MQKFDIINAIGRQLGGTRYLEICTPTTGFRFSSVKNTVFGVRHRALYNCPAAHDDGAAITFRTPYATSHDMLRALAATLSPEERYDIVFVDPFHEYHQSVLDLNGALSLLKSDGVLVVHDCNPPNASIAAPEMSDGLWCGVTYKAFVNFLIGNRFAGHCTVDADFGCGVIFNTEAAVPEAWRGAGVSPAMARDWALMRDDDTRRFGFFEHHRHALLNLVTPDAFRAEFPLTENTIDPVQTQERASLRARLRASAKSWGHRVWNRLPARSRALPSSPDRPTGDLNPTRS